MDAGAGIYTYVISGNTYGIKDTIKETGAKWDKKLNAWTVMTKLSKEEYKELIVSKLMESININ